MLSTPAPSTPPQGGKVGSGAAIANYRWADETAARLADPQRRADEFLNAYKADPRISQAVDDLVSYLSTGSWSCVPASDRKVDEKAAKFVEAALLGYSGDRFGDELWPGESWFNILRTIGYALAIYGHAVLHKKWRRTPGGFLVLDKLTFLEPRTLEQWVLDAEDNITRIVRSYRRGDGDMVVREGIDAADLVVLTHRLIGAGYEGIGVVRSMWAPYVRKEYLQRLRMIAAKRRLASIPAIKVDASITPHSEEWARLEQFLASVSDPDIDSSFLMASVLPEFIESKSVGPLDALDAFVKAENAELAAGGGTKSQFLGETTTGARALGDSIGARESVGLNDFAFAIADQLTNGVGGCKGLVRELVELNIPGAKPPCLTFTPTRNEKELAAVQTYIDGVSKGALTPTVEAEARVYAALGWDDIDADAIAKAKGLAKDVPAGLGQAPQQPQEGAADAGRDNTPDPSAEAPTEAPTAPETASA